MLATASVLDASWVDGFQSLPSVCGRSDGRLVSDPSRTPVGERPPAEPGTAETPVQTFLIVDVRGYTRFTQENGDEAAGQLAAAFAELSRGAVKPHHGEVLELRGDEALCVFASARQALRAAVELQTSFRRRTDNGPAFPLPIGIGLDAGEAVPIEGGYRGGALNTASRLCGLAGPGEILASETIVGLARRVDGIRFVHRRPVRLKGIEKPVRVIEVVPEADLPPLPDTPKAKRVRVTRRRLAVAVGAGLAVLAATAGLLLTQGGGIVVAANSLVAIDPQTNEVVSSLQLSPGIGALAVGEGAVWVANQSTRSVERIHPDGSHVVKTIGLGIGPEVVAVGEDAVWAGESNYSEPGGTGLSAVTRIDPKANEPRATVRINPRDTFRGGGEVVLAAGAGAVWVSVGDGHAYRLDPAALAAPAVRIEGVDALEIAAGLDAVWMVEPADRTVTRVDPATNVVRVAIPIGAREPSSAAVGAGSVWVTDLAEDTLWRIDPVTHSVIATIAVGDGPTAVAATDDAVWVANRFAQSVSRIDPKTNTVVATIPLGYEPRGIAVGSDSVWVTVAA